MSLKTLRICRGYLSNLKNYFSILFSKSKYLLYSSVTDKVVYLFLLIFLARNSSISNYGLIISSLAFANIINSFFELGFSNYLQREAAISPLRISDKTGTILNFRFILFILFVILNLVYSRTVPNNAVEIIVVASILVYVTSIVEMMNKMLYATDKYALAFKIVLLSRWCFIVLLITMAFFRIRDIMMLYIYTGSIIMQVVSLTIVLVKQQIIIPRFKLNIRLLKRALKASMPMGLGVSFVYIYDKVDVILIQNIIDLKSVGIYAVAYSVYRLPQFFTNIFLTPLYSRLSLIFFREKYIRLPEIIFPTMMLFITSLIFMSSILFLARYIIHVLYGDLYLGSATYLVLLVVAIPAYFLNSFTGVILNSSHHQVNAILSSAIAMVISVGFNILFLSKLGVMAAVWATLLTEHTILIIQIIYIVKNRVIR